MAGQTADDTGRLKALRAVARQHGYKLLKSRRGSIIEQLNPTSRGPFYRLVGPDGGEHAADLEGIEQHMDLLNKGVTLQTTTACGMPIGKIRLEW